jgi:hypothetical protein
LTKNRKTQMHSSLSMTVMEVDLSFFSRASAQCRVLKAS